MRSFAVTALVFLCCFGGALFSLMFRLPRGSFDKNTKEVVTLSTGMIATMAALILGLLIASAKNTYDTKVAQVRQMTSSIILLDFYLDQFGPEGIPIRRQLRKLATPIVDKIWSDEDAGSDPPAPFEITSETEEFFQNILKLTPSDEPQRQLYGRIFTIAEEISQMRLRLFTQASGSLQTPVLAAMVFWLVVIFAAFGLFARTSQASVIALFVGSCSASAAIYLILELERPFSGLMKIPSEPLRNALAPLAP